MRNIVILNSLHFSYPLPILMRVSYNTLIVKQNTSDYYKYRKKIKVRKVALTKNNHNALISLHIANIIRPIDKNYRQKIFNTPKQPSFIL